MAESAADAGLEDTVVVGDNANNESKQESDDRNLQSLLDHHLEEDNASFSRLFLVAQLAVSDQEAMDTLGGDFERLAKDFRMPVTGLIAVQDEVFVAALECFADDLCTLVRRVSDLASVSALKIIANSEDCPSRQFMPITVHRLRLTKEREVDLDGEFGDVATAGFAAYDKVLKIGRIMRNANNGEFPAAESANIPSNSRCLAYLKHDGFFTAEQFLEVYDDPVHEVAVTDLLWPHPGFIPLS